MKKLLSVLLLLATLTGSAHAAILIQSSNGTYVANPAVLTLAVASTSTACAGKRVSYTTDQALTANLVWPADRELVPENGAVIDHGAYTVSIAGSTGRWPLSKIFVGTGAVTFGVGSADAVPTAWFGSDTAAFNKAMASAVNIKKVQFPSGSFTINDTITGWTPAYVIEGASKESTIITMTDPAKFAFKFAAVGATDNEAVEGNGTIRNMTINAKYGIALNDVNTSGYAEADWLRLKLLHKFTVENCSIIGDYSSMTDVAADTTPLPTEAGLWALGVGVQAAKVFQLITRQSTIKGYGVGVYLYGSDLSEVESNRIANNGVHVWIRSAFTYGYQCRVKKNDLLASYRGGAVTIKGGTPAWNTVEDNYFENVPIIATRGKNANYLVDYGIGTVVDKNRFDDYGYANHLSTPLLTTGGAYGGVYSKNRVARNAGATAAYCPVSFDSTDYSLAVTTGHVSGLVKFNANSNTFPLVLNPMADTGNATNPLFFSPTQKPADFYFSDSTGGGIANASPYAQDANGNWYFQTGTFDNAVNLKAPQSRVGDSAFTLKLRTKCKVATPFNAYISVYWIDAATGTGTYLADGNITHAGNTAVETHTVALTRTVTAPGYFRIYVTPAHADVYSIEIY